MIKIAICDDDKKSALLNEALTRDICKTLKTPVEITIYGNGDFLLYDVQEKVHFDLILLDIEMPGNNGMNIAEKIKVYLKEVLIIFITSHLKYAIDSFELSIFRYIPKEVLDKKLKYALEDAFKLINIEAEKEYIISTPNRFEKIPYRDIIYIQKDGKNSIFITINGKSKIRKSLAKVIEEINSEEFIFIDRGCVINVIYINCIKDTNIILKNGVILPMSLSRISEVKKFISTYWSNQI